MSQLQPDLPAGTDLSLSISNISKRFCRDLKRSLFYGVKDIGRELVGLSPRVGELRKSEFWALDNINLELGRGTSLGLVGLNGSGKTTLMRIIAGLIKPTTGVINVRGRLAPLLALGAGFNQILTGRENIYTNMSILGLTKDEIDARFDEVVEFSEIGYALDAPVQTYSSGMSARLGFACALFTDPDVLVVDEVLAVGDMKFKEKCVAALMERHVKGMSLILVHHSPDIILSTCERALYLQNGQVLAYGGADEVIDQYEKDMDLTGRTKVAAAIRGKIPKNLNPFQSEQFEITHVNVVKRKTSDDPIIHPGDGADIHIGYDVRKPLPELRLQAKIYRIPDAGDPTEGISKTLVFKTRTPRKKGVLNPLTVGNSEVIFSLPTVVLRPGNYQIQVDAFHGENGCIASCVSPRLRITPRGKRFAGQFFQPHRWADAATPDQFIAGQDDDDDDDFDANESA